MTIHDVKMSLSDSAGDWLLPEEWQPAIHQGCSLCAQIYQGLDERWTWRNPRADVGDPLTLQGVLYHVGVHVSHEAAEVLKLATG